MHKFHKYGYEFIVVIESRMRYAHHLPSSSPSYRIWSGQIQPSSRFTHLNTTENLLPGRLVVQIQSTFGSKQRFFVTRTLDPLRLSLTLCHRKFQDYSFCFPLTWEVSLRDIDAPVAFIWTQTNC